MFVYLLFEVTVSLFLFGVDFEFLWVDFVGFDLIG